MLFKSKKKTEKKELLRRENICVGCKANAAAKLANGDVDTVYSILGDN